MKISCRVRHLYKYSKCFFFEYPVETFPRHIHGKEEWAKGRQGRNSSQKKKKETKASTGLTCFDDRRFLVQSFIFAGGSGYTTNDMTETMGLPVGETDYEPVLGRVVFTFVLSDHCFARLVIRLAFAATAPFRLVTSGVGLVLRKFDARH